ncbi:unnamed protein product, partial [Ectocarpus fasciculatus]
IWQASLPNEVDVFAHLGVVAQSTGHVLCIRACLGLTEEPRHEEGDFGDLEGFEYASNMLFGGILMLFGTLILTSLEGLAQKQHAAAPAWTAGSSAFVFPPSAGTTPIRFFRHVNAGSSGGDSSSRRGNGDISCEGDAINNAVSALRAGGNGCDLGDDV